MVENWIRTCLFNVRVALEGGSCVRICVCVKVYSMEGIRYNNYSWEEKIVWKRKWKNNIYFVIGDSCDSLINNVL